VRPVNQVQTRDTSAPLGHLLDLDHEWIAFIGDLPQGDHLDRQTAFRETLERLDKRPHEEYLLDVANGPEGGNAALQALLCLPDPPTAICAANDQLATGVLHAAWGHGIRVPDDMSITGFDDLAMAAFTVPPLTTVHMPIT
jgi:LacI family transcriptional regulator